MKTPAHTDASQQLPDAQPDVGTPEHRPAPSGNEPAAASASAETGTAERRAAKKRLIDRLQQQSPTGSRAWVRDALYDF